MHALRLFCSVAQHRSFSQAAQDHGITQSAASQRVSALEKRLTVKLIDRSVRPLALTGAGEVFLDGVRDLLAHYERLEVQVARLRPQLTGSVRVSAIYSAGIGLLQQVQESFQARHPQVNVIIHYARPDDVYDAVRHQQCDLGILSYPQRWRDVGIVLLRDEVMAVVCSPEHELAGSTKVHASALGSWQMVTFELSLPVGRAIGRYLRDHGAIPHITDRLDNIDTIKNSVSVTDRFSILPKRTVMREVAAGTLAVVELEPTLTRPMGIIYHRRNGTRGDLAPAVRAFVEFHLHHAGPGVDRVDAGDAADGQMVGGKVG